MTLYLMYGNYDYWVTVLWGHNVLETTSSVRNSIQSQLLAAVSRGVCVGLRKEMRRMNMDLED